VALAQGGYWLVTGLWPLLHYRSFEKVSGPKREPWLVKTVGALVAVVGGTLLGSGLRKRITPALRFLGLGSAGSLAAVDTVYAGRGRISPVYLGDALVEGALAAAWLASKFSPKESWRPVAPEPPKVGGCFDIAPGESRRAEHEGGGRDLVDEAAMESFPASDPPAH
jgi:hypothetical protein